MNRVKRIQELTLTELAAHWGPRVLGPLGWFIALLSILLCVWVYRGHARWKTNMPSRRQAAYLRRQTAHAADLERALAIVMPVPAAVVAPAPRAEALPERRWSINRAQKAHLCYQLSESRVRKAPRGYRLIVDASTWVAIREGIVQEFLDEHGLHPPYPEAPVNADEWEAWLRRRITREVNEG